MAFTTTTLRDTVVDQAGAGGTVTILVNISFSPKLINEH